MNILVLNAGSSSLKFQVIDCAAERVAAGTETRRSVGAIEKIGSEARAKVRLGQQAAEEQAISAPEMAAAMRWLVDWLHRHQESIGSIEAVGHRIVHGGERFEESVRIDAAVIAGIEACMNLAPLHNKANLAGVTAATQEYGAAMPQVAVFDTAFHRTLPAAAYTYAIPYALADKHGIRRYGFHGTSHRYVSGRYAALTGRPGTIVTLHLGNGCSAAAIQDGKVVETSMGMTPLEGLVMGTRSGDLDPAVVDFIAEQEALTAPEVDQLLNTQSGLLGISGLTNDMRTLMAAEADNPRAALAVDVFCHRVRKYVGAYLAVLGGAEAIVFTGGIGENAAEIRERVCAGFAWAGLTIDPAANRRPSAGEREISEPRARLKAYVIPTDEELLIARDTARLVSGT